MKYVSVLLLLLLISCKQEKSQLFLDLFAENQEVQLFEIKGYPMDSLQAPDMILGVGDYIILSEPKLNSLLSCYNYETAYFKRFLSKGQGANEVINVQTMGYCNNEKGFYVHDVMGQSVSTFLLKDTFSILTKDAILPEERICSISYDDSLAFFTKAGTVKHFAVRTNLNKFIDFGNDIYLENKTPEAVTQILQGPSVVSPAKKRMAWFSVYGDVFEVYDFTDFENIRLIRSVVGTLPVFSTVGGMNSAALEKETKLGVSSVATNDQFLFALYNENTLEDAIKLKDEVFYSNKILIFDWEGMPYKVLNLDKKIRSLSYWRNKNMIICLGLDTYLNPALYYIDLGQINI